MSRKGAVYFSR